MRSIWTYLMFSFVCLSGCTAHMSGLTVNRYFTEESLLQGGLIWAGITAADKKWSSEEQEQYWQIVADAITRKRPDIPLRSPQRIIRKLGEALFSDILHDFSTDGELSHNSLTILQSSASGTRYILFSRIVKDRILHHHRSEVETGDPKQQYTTVYETVRETAVYSRIFDLTTLMPVWSGTILKKFSKTNVNPHSHNKSIGQDIVNELLEDAVFGDYPKPKSLEKILKRAFTGIAGNFPQKK